MIEMSDVRPETRFKLGAKALIAARRIAKHKKKQVNFFGDVVDESADGSVDTLGAGLRMQAAASQMMLPQDRITIVRERDPQMLKMAIAKTIAQMKARRQGRWSEMTADQTAAKLGSSLDTGLSTEEALELLKTVGPNKLEEGKPTSFMTTWLLQMKDIMNIIILTAALVNFFAVKDRLTGAGMFLFFWVSTLFNAMGEYSNADGNAALSQMVSPGANVIRDGVEVTIPAVELVPGDIVEVNCGDTIPADMRVSSAIDLRVEESVLTGESKETKKMVAPDTSNDPFPANMLYASTSCVAGKGTAVVTETGMKAQVGLIAENLNVAIAGLSPLQRTMNQLGGTVGFIAIAITISITILAFYRKHQDPQALCDEEDAKCFFFKALSQGLILGLSAVPVTLPLMTNTLLTTARLEITRSNAIVRRTSSIETLGCCMAICSDKTGTLTEGKMTAVKAVMPRKGEGVIRFAFYPTRGADPAGAIFKEEELTKEAQTQIDAVLKNEGKKFPLRTYGASGFSALPRDSDDAHVQVLLTAASLNSYSTGLAKSSDGKWIAVGNPSEGALVVAAAKAGIGVSTAGLKLTDASKVYPSDPGCEVPFSSSRKMACTVHAVGGKNFAGGLETGPETSHVAIIKGAPDRLLPLIENSLVGRADGLLTLEKGFDSALKEEVLKQNGLMAEQALRVLLLCLRPLTSTEVNALRELSVDDRLDMLTKNMAVVGAFGILDPPKPSVRTSIARCKQAGMRVVMITGDQLLTAGSIGLSLDIITDNAEARLCSELHVPSGAAQSEETIDDMVLKTSVWARAQPADKVMIVESLQRMGFTAAMTGDGVNDAPALKLADIGTAMGLAGTEVAKGAADLVLMDDDFTTIVAAVQEGRRAYANIQTYVGCYMTMCLPEVFTYATCVIVGLPMPLTSLQMMALGGIAHVLPPLLLTKQPLPEEAMSVPPRRPDSKLLTRPVLMWISIPWILIWWAAWTSLNVLTFWLHTGHIYIHVVAEYEREVIEQSQIEDGSTVELDKLYRGIEAARSQCFLSCCFADLWLVLAFSTAQPTIQALTRNRSLTIAVVLMAALSISAVYAPWVVPSAPELTGLYPLKKRDLCLCFAFVIFAHIIMEVLKIGYRQSLSDIIELRRYHAKMIAKGLLSVQATDREVQEFRQQDSDIEMRTPLSRSNSRADSRGLFRW